MNGYQKLKDMLPTATAIPMMAGVRRAVQPPVSSAGRAAPASPGGRSLEARFQSRPEGRTFALC